MRALNWPAILAVLALLGALTAAILAPLAYVLVLGFAAVVAAVLSLRQ